jgi:glycosyltransferase involved in cell wall biosynthesis
VEQVTRTIICTVTNDLHYDQRMLRICTSLAGAGYNVELVGRLLPTSGKLRERPYKQTRLKCFINKGKLFYIEYNIRLFLFLLFRKADVYSAVDLDTLLAATFAAKIRSRKLAFDAHEYFTEVPEVTGRKFTKNIWERVAQMCIPHADLAYTVNSSLAGIFSGLYRTTFGVIRSVPFRLDTRNGYAAPPESIPATRPVILYQGALNEGRGIEQCILAMKQIDAEFRIIGEGDLSEKLRSMVTEHGLKDKVKFQGFVLPEQLAAHTKQATIGYNVFENKGLSYYYSLNNKFFDYIQSHLPQICTPYPEFEKINAEYGVGLTATASVDEIVVAVNRLLNDKTLYETLKANCKKAAEVFNWQHEEQELIRLYKQII